MGLPLQIFHAERGVRQYAPDGSGNATLPRNHRQRAKKFGLILCMASSIRPIFSMPCLRELLASPSSPFVASAARCARRVLGGAASSLRSSRSTACSALPRLESADGPVAPVAAGVSALGFVTVRGETGARVLPGMASLRAVAVLVVAAAAA